MAKARGTKLGKPENLTEAARIKGAGENRNQAVTAYALISPLVKSLRTEGLSFGAIAERLNEKGYTTRTGSTWSAMQVKRVLDRSAAFREQPITVTVTAPPLARWDVTRTTRMRIKPAGMANAIPRIIACCKSEPALYHAHGSGRCLLRDRRCFVCLRQPLYRASADCDHDAAHCQHDPVHSAIALAKSLFLFRCDLSRSLVASALPLDLPPEFRSASKGTPEYRVDQTSNRGQTLCAFSILCAGDEGAEGAESNAHNRTDSKNGHVSLVGGSFIACEIAYDRLHYCARDQ